MRIRTGAIAAAVAAVGLLGSAAGANGQATTRPTDATRPAVEHHRGGGHGDHPPMGRDGHRPFDGRRWEDGPPHHGRPEAAEADASSSSSSAADDRKAIVALTKQVRELTAAIEELRAAIANGSRGEDDGDRRPPRRGVDRDDGDGHRPDRYDDHGGGHRGGHDGADDDDRGGHRPPHDGPPHHDDDRPWHYDWRDRD